MLHQPGYGNSFKTEPTKICHAASGLYSAGVGLPVQSMSLLYQDKKLYEDETNFERIMSLIQGRIYYVSSLIIVQP